MASNPVGVGCGCQLTSRRSQTGGSLGKPSSVKPEVFEQEAFEFALNVGMTPSWSSSAEALPSVRVLQHVAVLPA